MPSSSSSVVTSRKGRPSNRSGLLDQHPRLGSHDGPRHGEQLGWDRRLAAQYDSPHTFKVDPTHRDALVVEAIRKHLGIGAHHGNRPAPPKRIPRAALSSRQARVPSHTTMTQPRPANCPSVWPPMSPFRATLESSSILPLIAGHSPPPMLVISRPTATRSHTAPTAKIDSLSDPTPLHSAGPPGLGLSNTAVACADSATT